MNNQSITSIQIGQNLTQYIRKINKIPMLTEEEEIQYSQEKENGNLNAAKMLISSHLRYVVKIANQYKNYGLPMMDLISEGNIGLIRAVKTFDYKKGYRLSTYSIWWIRAFIQEYILKTWSIVKIGTSSTQKKLFFNLKKIKNDLLSGKDNKYLNDMDIENISEILNVSKQDVVDMDCRTAKGDFYLNSKSKTDEETEVIDLIASQKPLQDNLIDKKRQNIKNHNMLTEAIKTLNEREQDIIKIRKLTDKPITLLEVSKKYNISGERARQIENRAMEKIKEYFKKFSK